MRWTPVDGVLSDPVVSDDGLTVTYREVWPGVDLRYRLSTDAVKEDIVVSSAAVLPADGVFRFDVAGPGVQDDGSGHLRFEGALASDFSIGEVEVEDSAGLPISFADQVSQSVGGRRNGLGGDRVDTVSIGVDPGWVAGLPASAFPSPNRRSAC